MFARFAITLSLIVISLSGCQAGPKVTVNGIVIYERRWNEASTEVRQRASFDLNCPAEQLELTLFARVMRDASDIGVTGCGQRARYILTGAGTWMLYSRSTDGQESTAPGIVPLNAPPAVN